MTELALDVPACLRRVRRRDEDAARSLVNHLYPLVMKLVHAHLPRRMEAEDLAQMVFAKIFAHLEQYAGKVPFEHWVSRIAVNTCLNQLRSERCRHEVRWADLSEEESEVLEKITTTAKGPDPAEQLAARELAHKMLTVLGPEDRLVLSLMDLEERSVKDIQAITGWSTSLVRVRAFRARRKVRKHFAQLMKEGKI